MLRCGRLDFFQTLVAKILLSPREVDSRTFRLPVSSFWCCHLSQANRMVTRNNSASRYIVAFLMIGVNQLVILTTLQFANYKLNKWPELRSAVWFVVVTPG